MILVANRPHNTLYKVWDYVISAIAKFMQKKKTEKSTAKWQRDKNAVGLAFGWFTSAYLPMHSPKGSFAASKCKACHNGFIFEK